MKTIAIIPARGGSKGLPRKNIMSLGGMPLISYPIDAVRASGAVDRIFVTTDDEEIAEVAREHGAEVPFLRDPELARDETTMEDTLKHALAQFEAFSGESFDICVFVTPTDPFRDSEWITQAVRILKDKPEIESAFVGTPTFKNYWEALPDTGFQRVRPYMQVYGQRQERIRNKRIIYREDTGLACASRAFLWREGRRIGNQVEIIPNDNPFSGIDIHTEEDLVMAEQAMLLVKSSPDS